MCHSIQPWQLRNGRDDRVTSCVRGRGEDVVRLAKQVVTAPRFWVNEPVGPFASSLSRAIPTCWSRMRRCSGLSGLRFIPGDVQRVTLQCGDVPITQFHRRVRLRRSGSSRPTLRGHGLERVRSHKRRGFEHPATGCDPDVFAEQAVAILATLSHRGKRGGLRGE
jgi:hypothetical protein